MNAAALVTLEGATDEWLRHLPFATANRAFDDVAGRRFRNLRPGFNDGWHGCDHLAPVHEDDTLRSTLTVEQLEPLPVGGLVHLRSRVRAEPPGAAGKDVLDWRFVVVMA